MAWDFLTLLFDSGWFFDAMSNNPTQLLVYTAIVFALGFAAGRRHALRTQKGTGQNREGDASGEIAKLELAHAEELRRVKETHAEEVAALSKRCDDLGEELSMTARYDKMDDDEREALAWIASLHGGKFSMDFVPSDSLATFRTLVDEGILVEGGVEEWPDGRRVSFAMVKPWERWCESHGDRLPKVG